MENLSISSLLNPQNRRLFKLNIHAASGIDSFVLENFSGSEGLSRLYQFDLALLSDTANVKLKSLIGCPATLEIELANGTVRHVSGYINRFSSQGSDGAMSAMPRYSALGCGC